MAHSMRRHGYVGAFSLLSIDVMAAVNSQQNPTEPFERLRELPALYVSHTVISTSSAKSGGVWSKETERQP
jgi:hypothetical protein